MWMVDPRYLCRSHLLGEHRELHALVGIVKRGIRLDGYVQNGLIDTSQIKYRHEELVLEMLDRGYNHYSPLMYHDTIRMGRVDSQKNVQELRQRCNLCRERIDKCDRKSATA